MQVWLHRLTTKRCVYFTHTDLLWEKVHFRAKYIELCVKIAESGPLAVKLDYDTGENYSLSSTFSRCSDVRAPLLVLTASSQRRKVRSERTCTVRVNNRMCGVNTDYYTRYQGNPLDKQHGFSSRYCDNGV